MKLGLGLYGGMLNREHYRFARQAGATHIVAHIVGCFKKPGYDGVLIPDHIPAMSCDAPWHAGQAFALGYMRAALKMLNCLD
jgi:hypothetical protein